MRSGSSLRLLQGSPRRAGYYILSVEVRPLWRSRAHAVTNSQVDSPADARAAHATSSLACRPLLGVNSMQVNQTSSTNPGQTARAGAISASEDSSY
jgi:hypothetical protein